MRVKILLILGALLFAIVTSWFSYKAGTDAGYKEELLTSVENFEQGKSSFCDLNEDARLAVCPTLRRTLRFQNGAIMIYDCGNGEGFVSFVNAPKEIYEQIVSKLDASFLGHSAHCKNNKEEILWIRKMGKVAVR